MVDVVGVNIIVVFVRVHQLKEFRFQRLSINALSSLGQADQVAGGAVPDTISGVISNAAASVVAGDDAGKEIVFIIVVVVSVVRGLRVKAVSRVPRRDRLEGRLGNNDAD